jgi:hypothetical protein
MKYKCVNCNIYDNACLYIGDDWLDFYILPHLNYNNDNFKQRLNNSAAFKPSLSLFSFKINIMAQDHMNIIIKINSDEKLSILMRIFKKITI